MPENFHSVRKAASLGALLCVVGLCAGLTTNAVFGYTEPVHTADTIVNSVIWGLAFGFGFNCGCHAVIGALAKAKLTEPT
jgi:hypothetical protein